MKNKIDNDTIVDIYLLRGRGLRWDEVAEELGISYESIKYPDKRPSRNYIHFFTSKQRTVEETALFLGLDRNSDTLEKDVKFKLKELDFLGIRVYQRAGLFYMKVPQFATNHLFEFPNQPNIAIVSDTHIGSKHYRGDYLTDFYNYAHEEFGITHFFHAGDLSDGIDVYKGHSFEVGLHGFQKQRDYIVENYPNIPGVTTHIVSGNHDMSFYDKQGAHMLSAVCSERDDLHFLGDYGAFFMMNDFKVYLLHQKMGMSYAYSYPAQRIMQGLYGAMKPDLLILGHLHTMVSMNLRDTEVLQCDSFQDPTNLAIRKGYPHNISGIILQIDSLKVDDEHKQTFKYEKVRYGVHEDKLSR